MKIITLQNITQILAFLLFSYIAYALFFPFNPMEIERMWAINSPVVAGDTLLYNVKYCKHLDVTTTVYRTFYGPDGYLAPSPSIMSTTSPGCKTTTVPIETYTTMPPGEYYFRSDVEFKINPFRTIIVHAQIEPFIILPNK